MAKFTIQKGEHRAKPVKFGLWYKKKKLSREVIFDYNAKYFIQGADFEDINKLFGLGFFTFGQIWKVILGFFSQKLIPDALHHTDSIRIGWNYDVESNKIRLYSYTYVNGEINKQFITKVPLQSNVTCSIYIIDNNYTISITNNSIEYQSIPVNFSHSKKWSYLLGIYFGGDQTPDHDINITMNKTL